MATNEKYFRIQLVNVKLLSNKRKGKEAYKDILEKIHQQKISIPVKGGKHAILRTLFSTTFKENNDVVYGKFSKYTVLDGKEWINLETMGKEDVPIPKNKFPNLVESDYIFILTAHRFAIVLEAGINVNAVATFLTGAIKKVIDEDEGCDVIIEQSEDVFNEILTATDIQKLYISISYTNADTGDEAFEFMDNQLKESSIGKISIDASPDHTKKIKTNSTLISGALKVAKSNGYAKATIGTGRRKKKIETKMHPKTIPLNAETGLVNKTIFDTVMKLFRK